VAFPNPVRRASGVALSRGELTGAVGDSVTVLPIVVALAATTELGLGATLLWFGVFQIVWGLRYGLPMSVEPMKALAGLAIAGGLTYAEFATAGLVAGGVLLALGATGAVERVRRYVGEPVVRGVQLAVALVLLETAVGLSAGAPVTAGAGLAVAAVVAVAGRPRAAALAVLAVGGAVAVGATGVPTATVPAVAPLDPASLSPTAGALEGAAAQLAMTVGNAAVATSLLCADLFDADVSADDLATGMGAMTLTAVPLGGCPMCHGSGGLAGKHAFGARTGGANLLVGVGYLGAALVAAGALLSAFPMALLGVLLALVALQLVRAAAATDRRWLTALVGVLGLLANVGVAFVGGAALHVALSRRDGESS